jgi:hypothetical protein
MWPWKRKKSEPYDTFTIDIEELQRIRAQKKMELQDAISSYEFYLALMKSAPYAIISTGVAVVLALVTNQDVALYPIVAMGLLVLLMIHSRKTVRIRGNDMTGRKIDTDLIDQQYAFRADQVKQEYLVYRHNMSDYFHSYYSLNFSPTIRRFPDYVARWRPPLESQRAKSMKLLHKELFLSITSLEALSAQFFKEVDSFRGKVNEIITEKNLHPKTATPDEQYWRSDMARGLMICLTLGIKSKDDIAEYERTEYFDRTQVDLLKTVLDECGAQFLTNPGLQAQAGKAESLRVKTKELYDGINGTIAWMYETDPDKRYRSL